jgi:hypothetical protein
MGFTWEQEQANLPHYSALGSTVQFLYHFFTCNWDGNTIEELQHDLTAVQSYKLIPLANAS